MDAKMRGHQQPVQQQQAQQQAGPRKYDGQNGNPLYDPSLGGHYGACQKIALANAAPPPEVFTGTWANVSQGLSGQSQEILNVYWQNQVTKLETEDHDFKMHQLPLARIKKVMKADPEVKMISAEAPILFAKGCDIFITELTMRAWIHAEENKRRTLQRSDIASALAKSDMFDFLIDIVPREEAASNRRGGHGSSAQQPSAAAALPQGAVPQPGVHAQPQMAPSEYGLDPHMAPQGMYPGAVQQAPDPSAAYQYQTQIFDQGMYGYGIPQQPVSGF
ncbi:histone-fold-containing protein [Trichodelitschia bisporula]|uniref:Histone-fold-containing protein n=1 Tax=Trichodelitschia bisporula TaxID=703511 RepID=A0A6G1I7U7_9PEZI|nr:histone-fold-containing protein [Trichodelitschia bisporula]